MLLSFSDLTGTGVSVGFYVQQGLLYRSCNYLGSLCVRVKAISVLLDSRGGEEAARKKSCATGETKRASNGHFTGRPNKKTSHFR